MDSAIIANIKTLGLDMINEAGSGHPGIVLSAAPIMYTLYAKHLNINNMDEKWINRDRFVLSAGHGSALLYATLFMAGFPLELDDLKQFRKFESKTPGHPEVGVTPGVDMSTGPLGQGFASGVGMALAGKMQNEATLFPKKNRFLKRNLIDYNVYALCSDGDLEEGITSEAASLAGTLKLNNLIVLYDSNNVSLDSSTLYSFTENVRDKFKAMNWNTILVKNGNSVKEINKAIEKAKLSDRPTIIEIKTTLGYGSELAGTNKAHGNPLTAADLASVKDKLGVPRNSFFVDEVLKNNFKKMIMDRSAKKYNDWARNYQDFQNGLMTSYKEQYYWLFGAKGKINLFDANMKLEVEQKEATRVTNKKIMNEIAKYVPNYLGGSADLFSSINNYLDDYDRISFENYKGRNIYFGVREHAMGAILNGMALCNYNVYGSTFLSFADYQKPAIRMSALMNLPVTYIFSHDSIYVGEDGPTHQPVEQLAMLRSTPNLTVFRPCDANELLGSWNVILNKKGPNALILSRTEVPLLENSNPSLVEKGAYIIESEGDKLDGIIIATGTEVYQAVHIARDLKIKYQINLRIISMPSMELYENNLPEYKNGILPNNVKTFVMEAGSSFGWYKYVKNDNYLFNVNNFGKSGSKDAVSKYLEVDYETIENKILNILRQE